MATLILSAVAGETRWNESLCTAPWWFDEAYCTLAAEMACLRAKKTVEPKKSGGSPMPLLD